MTKGGSHWDSLLLLSAVVSIQLAGQLTPRELELLSAFFEVLGDNLALLALSPSTMEEKR